MSSGSIIIVSCGVSKNDISKEHIEAVKSADLLAGVSKFVNMFPDYIGDKLSLDSDFCQNIEALINTAKDKRVAVLASGDSLFYGISSMILRMAGDIPVKIVPNISSVQVACAKFLIPWSQAGLYSIHGKNGAIPINELLREKYAILLCDNKNTPDKIAKKIITSFPENKDLKIHVAENLGMSNERLITDKVDNVAEMTFDSLSIMIFNNSDNIKTVPSISLGRNDEFYNKVNNCITHSEVRAVVLSKLRIKPGIMWDIGAGSGSVGIEALGLCKNLTLYSVEQYQDRVENIKKNASNSFVNANIVEGSAPDCFVDLPDPDRVFIGGGGKKIVEIIAATIERLKPGGIVVCSAVLLETASLIEQNFKQMIKESIEINIKRAKKVGSGTVMNSDNAVKIYTITKDDA